MALPEGYAFYNIWFEIFCIIVTSLLLYKQMTVFRENDTEKAFAVVLTVQLLYFASFIPRVWVDTGALSKTVTAVYLTNIINFSVFAYCGYRAFVFLGLYENAPGFRLWGSRFWYSIPFLFNVVMVLSCPVTGVYFTVLPDATVGSGALWKLMVVINCLYPTMGLLSYFIRRKGEETADLKVAVIFPLFFIIFGPLSSLQWRIPILPFGLMLADLFVYVYYTDLLMGQRNQALENEKIAAERANTAKSEFLASMSHEIRTPINAVLGMNEMIIRESRNDRITLYARNVESAGKNLLAIINDILDFSKIEAGKMEITEGDYKLSSVLNDVTNMIAFKARTKDLKLEVDVDETLPDGLHGDEVRVRQVITNILNNAVKYTHEGSVTFQVSGERGAGSTLDLIVRVKDTGIGIREEDLPKLFNKFERVDLAQNSTVEGTGLGLSITQNLLRLMGGEIHVESEYGKGSTFTLRIPQKVVGDGPIGDFQEKFEQYVHEMKAYRESFRAPTARILVVDDTEMNLTVVEGLLSQTEVQMDTALSGAEALALTKDTPYDLILMDQRMPQMDGTEALRHIREQAGGMNRQTPVICLTADAVSGARSKYLEEGFTDYLSKPVESAAIEAALIKYLPASKVVLQKVRKASERAEERQRSKLETFYDGVEGLSYADAVKFCSNEELLRKTLEQFYRSIPSNADAIEGFLRERDYRNYTIKVHALKSSARLIGARALSEDARFLEECGNELSGEALQEIESRTPKLLSDYREYGRKLAPLYAAEEAARASAPEIPTETLREAYEAIRELALSFDIDSIDGVVAEVRKYRLPESEAARFEAVEAAARSMDWAGLEKALNEGDAAGG